MVDLAETTIIPIEYKELDFNSSGHIYVATNAMGKKGILNSSGAVILPFEYETINRKNRSSNLFLAKRSDKCEMKLLTQDAKIKEIYICDYEGLDDKNDNYFIFKKQNKFGLLSLEGKEIIPPTYDKLFNPKIDVDTYSSNIITMKGSKYGMLNSFFKEVIPLKYDNISILNSSLFIVELKGKKGLYAAHGEEYIVPTFDDISDASNNLLIVARAKKFGIYDITANKYLVTADYDFIIAESGIQRKFISFNGTKAFRIVLGSDNKVVVEAYK